MGTYACIGPVGCTGGWQTKSWFIILLGLRDEDNRVSLSQMMHLTPCSTILRTAGQWEPSMMRERWWQLRLSKHVSTAIPRLIFIRTLWSRHCHHCHFPMMRQRLGAVKCQIHATRHRDHLLIHLAFLKHKPCTRCSAWDNSEQNAAQSPSSWSPVRQTWVKMVGQDRSLRGSTVSPGADCVKSMEYRGESTVERPVCPSSWWYWRNWKEVSKAQVDRRRETWSKKKLEKKGTRACRAFEKCSLYLKTDGKPLINFK